MKSCCDTPFWHVIIVCYIHSISKRFGCILVMYTEKREAITGKLLSVYIEDIFCIPGYPNLSKVRTGKGQEDKNV